ncbi:hypothetical protein A2U01_0069986, partial [Trifolium medium]|nr:hypothetical protein [Trifolium medium]
TSIVFEDDGKEIREKGVEMIDGFELEEVEKLLLCGGFGAGSDDTEHHLKPQWRKHNIMFSICSFGEQMIDNG